MHHTKYNRLSEVQERVLALICEEKSNEEISMDMFISKRTVEWHKNKLIRKTGSKNIVGLIKYAIKNNIIRLDN